MSAWIVSKNHIDVLVHALGVREIAVGPPDEIGRELWEENHRSVDHRYREYNDRPDYSYERPTPERITASTPAHRLHGDTLLALDEALILQQAHCYDYQSCEHPGWEDSRAKQWIDALVAGLESKGVKASGPWGV